MITTTCQANDRQQLFNNLAYKCEDKRRHEQRMSVWTSALDLWMSVKTQRQCNDERIAVVLDDQTRGRQAKALRCWRSPCRFHDMRKGTFIYWAISHTAPVARHRCVSMTLGRAPCSPCSVPLQACLDQGQETSSVERRTGSHAQICPHASAHSPGLRLCLTRPMSGLHPGTRSP